jgi:L-fuconate dehydratase
MTHSGKITDLRVLDVRFPTSLALDGSDAMNPDPDYSAAYVVLGTDRGDGAEGHGLTFTIGRGTEAVKRASERHRRGWSAMHFRHRCFWRGMAMGTVAALPL